MKMQSSLGKGHTLRDSAQWDADKTCTGKPVGGHLYQLLSGQSTEPSVMGLPAPPSPPTVGQVAWHRDCPTLLILSQMLVSHYGGKGSGQPSQYQENIWFENSMGEKLIHVWILADSSCTHSTCAGTALSPLCQGSIRKCFDRWQRTALLTSSHTLPPLLWLFSREILRTLRIFLDSKSQPEPSFFAIPEDKNHNQIPQVTQVGVSTQTQERCWQPASLTGLEWPTTLRKKSTQATFYLLMILSQRQNSARQYSCQIGNQTQTT